MTVTWHGHGHLVVSGEIDMDTAGVFRDAVDKAIAIAPDELVIDAAALSFCDSTCVACIVRALQGGLRIRIVGASATLRRVLEIAGVHHHDWLTIE